MRRERGHAAVEFALAIGVLLLPVALVVVSFGPWLERQVTAEAAAAEATRTAVLELDLGAGARSAVEVTVSSGVLSEHMRLGWCGSTPSQDGSGSCPLGRGAIVEAEIELWVPLFNTPWGPVGGVWVSGHHAEPTDLYRSLG